MGNTGRFEWRNIWGIFIHPPCSEVLHSVSSSSRSHLSGAEGQDPPLSMPWECRSAAMDLLGALVPWTVRGLGSVDTSDC